MMGEHKRKVPAEFTKLTGQNVLILVWAQPETLFDYPYVRVETASHIRDKLAAELQTRKTHVDFVEPARSEDYLRRTLDVSYDPMDVGRKFDASMVVYIELLEFHVRDADAPDLLRGTVNASVAVYDLTAAADETQRYELEPVRVKYPENQPVMFSRTSADMIREGTYTAFAEVVARKFYDYEEDLETVGRPK
jgi:CO/xanthine dehydrogenase Mo-binding subunit